MKYLVPIDLSQNELQNARIQNLAAAPSSPVEGQIYYNSSNGNQKAYIWDGTAWVPWEANTDTKNTAGSTDTNSKIYLVGATSQAANPQTYSHDTAYVGTDGHLYSNSKQVVNLSDSQALTNKTYNGYTLAAASAKGVDTSISSGSSSTNLPTTAAVASFVSSEIGAVDAMRFKGTLGTGGTITTLPTTNVKTGDTYRVITAGTYAGVTCEVGDLIIATSTTPTWTVAQTNIDGAVTASTTTTSGYLAKFTGDKIVANGPQLGSSTSTFLRNDGSWASPYRTYTSTTGKPTGNLTPGFGDSITISQISQSTTGQITATDRSITIPNATATTSAAGLMSALDKTKLNNMRLEFIFGTINAGETSTTVTKTSPSTSTGGSPQYPYRLVGYTTFLRDSNSATSTHVTYNYEEIRINCTLQEIVPLASTGTYTYIWTWTIPEAIDKTIKITGIVTDIV